MQLSGRRFFLHCGVVLAAASLVACGGGGGGGGSANNTPSTTRYDVSGTVSGLTGGTLVLQVSGKPDVNVTANGNVSLATGVSNGSGYAVSVRTQPAGHECTVTNGTGNITGANVANVQIACSTEVRLSLVAPADDALVPVNAAQDISASFGNVTADELTWEVLPAGVASNVTLTQSSATADGVVMSFVATEPGDYTVQVTAQTDETKSAQVDLRVHQVYTAIDSFEQRRTFLRADGHVVGTGLGDVADQTGAPTDDLKAISQGWLFRLGIRDDGSVVRWGSGGGGGSSSVSPGTPPTSLVAKHVAAGSYFSIAIAQDDTLAVWGRLNASDATLPAGLASAKFIDADAVLGDYAGIEEDGTMVVWEAMNGGLRTLPTAWQTKSFTRLCATSSHVVAVDTSGTVSAWNTISDPTDAPLTPPGVTDEVSTVFCGSEAAVLVQDDGKVLRWVVGVDVEVPSFDSSSVSGFPRIKGASIFAIGETYFLTEGGAVIDSDGDLVTSIDSL